MLHFLLGLFIVGIIIMMMVTFPAFRNFVIFIVLAAGIGLWWIIENQNKQSREYEQKKAAEQYFATTAIKATDLRLEDVVLNKATYGLSDYILSGTLTNNSTYPLGSMDFEVTMNDCIQTKCVIVGQKTVSAAVQVPASQRRAFSSYAVRFDNLPPLNGAARSWNYKLISTRTN
jgi:hypothetical protein